MRARVTETGLLVPKSLLDGFDEVDIHQEDHKITIVPLSRDPILNLGRAPLALDMTDGSEHHDDYLYPA